MKLPSMEPAQNTSTNTTFTAETPVYSKTGWIIAFAVVAAITIIGNCLTLAVFLTTKILHRRSSYLIINLTIADGLVGVFSIPLFICILCTEDQVGDVLYNVYAFQDIVLGLTSVSTLMFIATERFYAVQFPLKYRALSPRAHIVMIANSWLCSTMVATARILTSAGIMEIKAFTYLMVFSITVPLILTCILYTIVWGISRARPTCGRAVQQENKLSVTLFIITSVFIISWTPFPIGNIVVTFWNNLAAFPGFITFINVTKLLHYSNSWFNPVIYTLKMTEFRRSLVLMLCRRNPQHGYEMPHPSPWYSRSSTISSRLSESGKKRKTDSP